MYVENWSAIKDGSVEREGKNNILFIKKIWKFLLLFGLRKWSSEQTLGINKLSRGKNLRNKKWLPITKSNNNIPINSVLGLQHLKKGATFKLPYNKYKFGRMENILCQGIFWVTTLFLEGGELAADQFIQDFYK